MCRKHFALMSLVLLLSGGASPALTQQGPGAPMMAQGARGGMAPGMIGHGMMGFGGMPAGITGLVFMLMDSDGDGTLSIEEFRTGHDRIFKGMDANKDGRLTLEEMQNFMQGAGPQLAQQQQSRQQR